MSSIPIPSDEAERLRLLGSRPFFDSDVRHRLDRIVQQASTLLGLPISLVSLIEADRQRFAACLGLSAEGTPREHSFCTHAIMEDEPFIVPDARNDLRFASNPLVLGAPHIRSYIGIPLKVEGVKVGTLCCIGAEPRNFSPEHIELLQGLAGWCERELELQESAKVLKTLRATQRENLRLFEEAPCPLMTVRGDGEIVRLNEIAQKFWELHLGATPNLLSEPAFASIGFREIFARARAEGAAELEPVKILSLTGEPTVLSCRVRTLPESGNFLISLEDLSELFCFINRESKLTKELNLLQGRDESFSDLVESLGVFSHEVRNTLSGVSSILELHGESQCVRGDEFSALQAAAKSLEHLVNHTLNFTKAEKGSMTVLMRPFEVSELLKSLLLLQTPQFKRKGLNLRILADAVTGHFLGDEEKVRQILLNLLSNSLKYTIEGSVELSVAEVENGLKFLVIDTGVGMDQDFIRTIFRPYVQGDKTNLSGAGGVGLGLSIVKSLVTSLGGRISARSELGKGSEFEVYLPLQRSSKVEPKQPQSCPLEKAKVMVVDDNSLNRRLMTLLLNNLGCEILGAGDGLECLSLQKESPSDLILLDYRMPKLNGRQTVELLRDKPDIYGKPVVFGLTGGGAEVDMSAWLEAGADACLLKPLGVQELRYRYAQCLKSRDELR